MRGVRGVHGTQRLATVAIHVSYVALCDGTRPRGTSQGWRSGPEHRPEENCWRCENRGRRRGRGDEGLGEAEDSTLRPAGTGQAGEGSGRDSARKRHGKQGALVTWTAAVSDAAGKLQERTEKTL